MTFDKFREECGLMGVWHVPEAANITYLGLYAQQHRGQEGAGVLAHSSVSGERFRQHKGLGLVSEVFSGYDFTDLPGQYSIGHVRYTTAGSSVLANVQPFQVQVATGYLGIAHNGNLINAESLRNSLIKQGSIFSSTSDTEIFLHLIARKYSGGNIVETVIDTLKQVQGAYSLLFLMEDRMLAVRDPHGLRPLALGALKGGIVVASETCAFDLIGATYLRDVEPGEVVEIKDNGSLTSYFPFGKGSVAPCIFEYVYFSRPDSNVYGRNVYEVRKRMGEVLAKESPIDADMVLPVPDSGITAALGYSQKSGIPLELGLIRNHYVGRTFIEPKQSIRDFGVKLKLNANPELLKDKRVVVVDDSIVRGTTSAKIVKMLRNAGAKEIHFRISAPPTTNPCYYGIDTPDKHELIASRMSHDEVEKFIGVDSLAYLSLEGLYTAVGEGRGNFCDACFSGDYPIGTPSSVKSKQKELFPLFRG